MGKKKPKNSGKSRSEEDVKKMKELAKWNTPTWLIAYKLGRTEASIYSKASQEKIGLKPTNQSPYNRRKKKSK